MSRVRKREFKKAITNSLESNDQYASTIIACLRHIPKLNKAEVKELLGGVDARIAKRDEILKSLYESIKEKTGDNDSL